MNKRLTLAIIAVLIMAGTAVAGGFEVENFKFWYNEFDQTIMIGEVVNNSAESYSLAVFQLALFDENDNMLDVHQINFTNFSSGERRSFKLAPCRVYPKKMKYRLDFDGGLPQT